MSAPTLFLKTTQLEIFYENNEPACYEQLKTWSYDGKCYTPLAVCYCNFRVRKLHLNQRTPYLLEKLFRSYEMPTFWTVKLIFSSQIPEFSWACFWDSLTTYPTEALYSFGFFSRISKTVLFLAMKGKIIEVKQVFILCILEPSAE